MINSSPRNQKENTHIHPTSDRNPGQFMHHDYPDERKKKVNPEEDNRQGVKEQDLDPVQGNRKKEFLPILIMPIISQTQG